MKSLFWILLITSSASAAIPQSTAPGSPKAGAKSETPVACPWLTSGTAERALGGDVDITVAATTPAEGSCRFSRRDQPLRSLEIRVGRNGSQACPAQSTPVTGIGNEAVRCRISTMHGEVTEMLRGRVRDVNFTLSLRGPKRTAKAADAQDEVLEQLAEQVAGNLY